MKQFVYLFFILFLTISCSREEDDTNSELTCSVEKPIENLDWLKSEIDLLINNEEQYHYIVQTEYRNQTVFIFPNCNPSINSVTFVKTCDGEDIGIIGSREEDIPVSVIIEGTIIWKSDNFECDI